MARQLDFTGKSRASYRYILLEDGPPMWPSGGNFIYVRQGERRPEIVYAGETESLFRGYREQWEQAQAEHGATAIYVRLNVSGSVRRAEHADIVAKHRPPMNALPPSAAAEKKPRARRAPRKAKSA